MQKVQDPAGMATICSGLESNVLLFLSRQLTVGKGSLLVETLKVIDIGHENHRVGDVLFKFTLEEILPLFCTPILYPYFANKGYTGVGENKTEAIYRNFSLHSEISL